MKLFLLVIQLHDKNYLCPTIVASALGVLEMESTRMADIGMPARAASLRATKHTEHVRSPGTPCVDVVVAAAAVLVDGSPLLLLGRSTCGVRVSSLSVAALKKII